MKRARQFGRRKPGQLTAETGRYGKTMANEDKMAHKATEI
jgi:hypothetical protein